MKLYKFRSLGSCPELDRVSQILTTGKFWCAQFWELNDPMEGVYVYNTHNFPETLAESIFSEKSERALCSFSKKRAFYNPLLWGYYANGFKGVAIEVETARSLPGLMDVKYVESAQLIDLDLNPTHAVDTILTSKLRSWRHEGEVRFLTNGTSGLREVGKISAVYFGRPYGDIDNAAQVQALPQVHDYRCRTQKLIEVARFHEIPCYSVKYVEGNVVVAGEIQGSDLYS